MPGRLFLTTPIEQLSASLRTAVPQNFSGTPRRNIAPGQDLVVCTADRDLRMMRWGIIPVGRVNARGRPVMETIVNARSETVFEKSAFQDMQRCIVPADGWYEWTGTTRRKTAWRIRRSSGAILGFAALSDVWHGPGGIALDQVATVTCAPNADVAPIHHRMGVILAPEDFDVWLGADDTSAAALMRPLADGLLHIEAANDVDWSGP